MSFLQYLKEQSTEKAAALWPDTVAASGLGSLARWPVQMWPQIHTHIQQIMATATIAAIAMLEVQRTAATTAAAAAKQRKHIRNRPATGVGGEVGGVGIAVGTGHRSRWPTNWDVTAGQPAGQTARKKPSAGSRPSWWKQFCTRLQTKIAATQETDSKNLLLKSIKKTEAGLEQLPFSLSFSLSLNSTPPCCSRLFSDRFA